MPLQAINVLEKIRKGTRRSKKTNSEAETSLENIRRSSFRKGRIYVHA